MKQRCDPLLGHFCPSLNENVTRAALIKFCAKPSLVDGTNGAPIAMRIPSALIIITYGVFLGAAPRLPINTLIGAVIGEG